MSDIVLTFGWREERQRDRDEFGDVIKTARPDGTQKRFQFRERLFDGIEIGTVGWQKAEVRAAIEHVGASLRFLPPYSPDFNPIEQAFAKLKAFMRAARPRSFDQVCALVATALRLPPNARATSDTAAIESLQRYEKRSRHRRRHKLADDRNIMSVLREGGDAEVAGRPRLARPR